MHQGISQSAERRLSHGLTVADVLRNQAQNNAEAIALSDPEHTFTFSEMHLVTNRLARGLLDAGVCRGATVGVIGTNSIEHVLIQHACSKIGAAVAVVNWRQSKDEVEYALGLVSPQIVFVQPQFQEVVAELDIPVADLHGCTSGPLYDRFIERFDDSDITTDVNPEDIATIIYTSGTTGRPKAAAISQRAMIARAHFAAIEMRLTAEDAHLAWAPMFHLVSADYMFICAVLGSRYVVVDGFEPDVINEYVHSIQLGWLVLMPGAIEPLLERLRKDKRPTMPIKLVGAMADLVPPAQIIELTTLLDAPFYNSYGMTEAGPLTKGLIPVGQQSENLGKQMTALSNYRLVVDGLDAREREPGELWVFGPTLFSNYVNDPKATSEAHSEGWYRSGDLLKRDSAGRLHFVSRSKYLIKRGGENIYPAEIERVLLTCPGVVEAVVVGKRDQKWGETPIAFIATDSSVSVESLEAACRNQLAGYKIPEDFRELPLEQFPRNVTGKVIREKLEELL